MIYLLAIFVVNFCILQVLICFNGLKNVLKSLKFKYKKPTTNLWSAYP